ncbi:MAG: hypothetical protein HY323_01515 [Betaproteobacteria bacterium]|nr:hypothetical protein [Betaproteobacteria bacterium]
MISPEETRYVLEKAYVPEHIVGMMTLVSGGEPFLFDRYLCFSAEGWAIVIGYPLEQDFRGEDLVRVVDGACRRFRPATLWLVAPEVPPSLAGTGDERESDHYYTLDLLRCEMKTRLGIVARASRTLAVETGREISAAHQELIGEFLERERPAPRVRALFLSMAHYVPRSESAVVLNAHDRQGRLAAFYVVELAAGNFATYMVGSHSKKRYVPGASDLLFAEMVKLAREHGKSYIHLGLGVNEGIRAFKTKWGGVPSLPYEFLGQRRVRPGIPEGLASKL